MIQALNAFMVSHLSLNEIFETAVASGVNTISIEIRHLQDKNLDAFKDKYDVSVSSAGALFLDLDKYSESLTEAVKIIDLCHNHGIPAINVVLKSEREMNEWLADAVSLCRAIVEAAEKKQVRINVEPLNPGMRSVTCITSLCQAAVLCRYIESDSFGITADLYHFSLMDDTESYLRELLPRIGAVHMADTDKDGNACQVGTGLMKFKGYLETIIGFMPSVTVELEVIDEGLSAYTKEKLPDYIRTSFINVSKTVIIGELCVHRYLYEDSGMLEYTVGGGAGVIASQINALGSTSYLVGICGDDRSGNEIAYHYQAEYGFSDIVRQEAGHTADVRLSKDNISITPGNIQVSLLEPVIDDLKTDGCVVYLPLFPGYENIYKILEGRNNRLICDFGFYEWCGDFEAIKKRLSHFNKGYCALINGKDLEESKKAMLGELAVKGGFEYAIVTDSDKSVFLADSKSSRRYEIVRAKAVSECGAGDSMIAGILYMLERGAKMEDALSYGISVAYRKVQKNGVWKKKDGKSIY